MESASISVLEKESESVLPQLGHYFICHSSKNHELAMKIVSTLESNGRKCWIAPRDIVGSDSWGRSIIEALESAKTVIVLVSNASQSSPQVLREVERSVHNRVPILPVLIEDLGITKEFEYFLSACHWLDVKQSSPEAVCDEVLFTVNRIDDKGAVNQTLNIGDAKLRVEKPNLNIAQGKLTLLAIVAAVVLLSILFGFLFFHRDDQTYSSLNTISTNALSGTFIGEKVEMKWSPKYAVIRSLYQDVDGSIVDPKDISYEVEIDNGEAQVVSTSETSFQSPIYGRFKWRVRAVVSSKNWKGEWSEQYVVANYENGVAWLKGVGSIQLVAAEHYADEAHKLLFVALGSEIEGLQILERQTEQEDSIPVVHITEQEEGGVPIFFHSNHVSAVKRNPNFPENLVEHPTIQDKLDAISASKTGVALELHDVTQDYKAIFEQDLLKSMLTLDVLLMESLLGENFKSSTSHFTLVRSSDMINKTASKNLYLRADAEDLEAFVAQRINKRWGSFGVR